MLSSFAPDADRTVLAQLVQRPVTTAGARSIDEASALVEAVDRDGPQIVAECLNADGAALVADVLGLSGGFAKIEPALPPPPQPDVEVSHCWLVDSPDIGAYERIRPGLGTRQTGNYSVFLRGGRDASGLREVLRAVAAVDSHEAGQLIGRAHHIEAVPMATGVDEAHAVRLKKVIEEYGGRARITAGREASNGGGGREPIPEHVRHDVWRRDDGACVDCGSRKLLEYDHIIPVSRGGSNTARNIELRCESCNRRKGARI